MATFRLKAISTTTTAKGGKGGVLALGTTVGLTRHCVLDISHASGGWIVEVIRVTDSTHVVGKLVDDSLAMSLRSDLSAIPVGAQVFLPNGQQVADLWADDAPPSLATPVPDHDIANTIEIQPDPLVLKGLPGVTQQMTALLIEPAPLPPIDVTAVSAWSSSDPTKATITAGPGGGLVTLVAGGSTDISVVNGTKSHTHTILTATLDSLSISPGTPTVKDVAGSTQQFTATAHYSDGSTADFTALVSWTSGTPGTCTVGLHTGLATMVAAGTSVITAAYAGLTSVHTTLTFISLDSIVVTPATPAIRNIAGATQAFTATGHYSDASTADITTSVVWSSGTPATMTISASTGVATMVAAGTSVITATKGIVSGNTTATFYSLVSLAVTPATPTIAASGTQQMTATATWSAGGGTTDVTSPSAWTSGTPAAITINASTGLATWVAAGTSVLTATYLGVSGNTTATAASSSLLPDDAGTLVNLFVQGGVLKDTKNNGGADWVPVGTPGFDASADLGFPSGLHAEGCHGSGGAGSGWQLGAGNWAASPTAPVWVTVVCKPTTTGEIFVNNHTASHGMRVSYAATSMRVDALFDQNDGDAVGTGAPLIFSYCIHASGADKFKTNGNAVGASNDNHTMATGSGNPLKIIVGSTTSILYALRITTTQPSDADITALHTAIRG